MIRARHQPALPCTPCTPQPARVCKICLPPPPAPHKPLPRRPARVVHLVAPMNQHALSPEEIDTIYRVCRDLAWLSLRLARYQLSDRRRQELGGHLFRSAPRFVRIMAGNLSSPLAAPDRGPDPMSPTDLLADQRGADALRTLRAHLLVLSRSCGDGHLVLQSRGVKGALAALRAQQRHIGQGADPHHLDRLLLLFDAIIHLPLRWTTHRPRSA